MLLKEFFDKDGNVINTQTSYQNLDDDENIIKELFNIINRISQKLLTEPKEEKRIIRTLQNKYK
ncbi:hypothetical protein [Mycoplasmoides alvi]|uniref:hypothetical protein n=1 Tax=Mycoplasmoides alvi TaxID=78580 RepID=UPI00051CAC24|nr:hypothetical protein [Mycoplasmoides alvi]